MTAQNNSPNVAAATVVKRGGRVRRGLEGGKLGDLRRLPRYVVMAALGITMIWAPIVGYLKTAPLSYKSQISLILPGSGASASLNLNGIGQASSYANSAFASNAVSPTETYKRLLGADRILKSASDSLGIERSELGKPRVRLVDQTSLIHVEINGPSPMAAQQRGEAVLAAFFMELDSLRADEVATREDSGLQAIADYRGSVGQTRTDIEQLQTESDLLSVKEYNELLDRHLALETLIRDRRAAHDQSAATVSSLAKQLGLNPELAATTLKLFADVSYLAVLDEIAKHEAALADASSQYGFQHPIVVEARGARDSANAVALQVAHRVTGFDEIRLASLDFAPQGARSELLAQLVRMEAERRGVAQELTTLEAQFTEGEADLRFKAAAAAKLQDLERDFSVAEAVFASAIARAQSSKSDVYASYPLVQVLENPSLADRPSSPNRMLAYAAGSAASLMLLFGLLIGWIRFALISRLLSRPGDLA